MGLKPDFDFRGYPKEDFTLGIRQVKRCTCCYEIKSYAEFDVDSTNRTTGLHGQCKECLHNGGRARIGEKTALPEPNKIKPANPKERWSIMARVKELMSLDDSHYAIAQKMIDIALEGDKDMIKYLVDRIDGPVKQVVEMNGEITNTNIQIVASADELIHQIRSNQIREETKVPLIIKGVGENVTDQSDISSSVKPE
jgi:hypothetical protein